MTAITNLVVSDATNTITFVPVMSGPTSMWRETDAAKPFVQLRSAKVQVPQPDRKTKLRKIRINVKLPVLETVNGTSSAGYTAQPKEAYSCTFDGVFIIPERATAAEATKLRWMVVNMLNYYNYGLGTENTSTAQIRDCIDNAVAPV